jgi:hypothetical protein
VTPHFLNNVLLLHFALKAAKGVFERFTLLQFYLGQTKYTSQPDLEFSCELLGFSDTLVTGVVTQVDKYLHFA